MVDGVWLMGYGREGVEPGMRLAGRLALQTTCGALGQPALPVNQGTAFRLGQATLQGGPRKK
jgi:hypothetical protein